MSDDKRNILVEKQPDPPPRPRPTPQVSDFFNDAISSGSSLVIT